MPYVNNSELPESVTKNLAEYADSKKRRSAAETREQVAHKVAWTAVKKKYSKKDGYWQEKI